MIRHRETWTDVLIVDLARSEHRVQLLRRLEGASQHSQESLGADTGGAENPLDGCLHVFIDLGSNRGLQIRKLYEPNTFPLAPVLPLYQKYFGRPEDRNLQEICSVGQIYILRIQKSMSIWVMFISNQTYIKSVF